jgi:monofunctional glycosyltransferase
MSRRKPKPGLLRRGLKFVLRLCLAYVGVVLLGLFVLRIGDPPITGVQLQRMVAARLDKVPYERDYRFVPLSQISVHLRHAVVAAEDGRFYQHSGVDWREVAKVVEEEVPKGRIRGASTITQQLVKNLFMTNHAFPLRKPIEWVLAPAADLILSKHRQLEIYLNIAEWGPGVFGAEAAAQHHYGVSAARLNREQSARLAAILPSPLRWRPEEMNKYSAIILKRMEQRDW